MSAYTATQLRAFLKTLLSNVYGETYTVYDSRVRLIAEDRYPTIRVGVSGGSEDDSSLETMTALIVIGHGASGTDFTAPGGPDLVVTNRVDADLLTLRNALNQSNIGPLCGAITRINWDYGQSDESGRLLAWVAVSVTFERRVFYTDDLTPDDFDSVNSETTIDAADTTVTAGLLA
jgi:hypothetical protein